MFTLWMPKCTYVTKKKKKAFCEALWTDYPFFLIPRTVLSCQNSFMLFLISFPFRTHKASCKPIYILLTLQLFLPHSLSLPEPSFKPSPLPLLTLFNLKPWKEKYSSQRIYDSVPSCHLILLSPLSAILCQKVTLLPALLTVVRVRRQNDCGESFLEITAQ